MLQPQPLPAVLGTLRQSCIECTACSLHRGPAVEVTPVFGRVADSDADVEVSRIRIVLVGEAPGPTENQSGRPFIGSSGDVLASLLRQADIDPSTVWVTNTVACFPHKRGERDKPQIAEPPLEAISTCTMRHLDAQLREFPQAVIVALGRTAATGLLGRPDPGAAVEPIKLLRGVLSLRPGEAGEPRMQRWRDRPVLVTYHPAYLIRCGYSASAPASSHEDAETVLRVLVRAREVAALLYPPARKIEPLPTSD